MAIARYLPDKSALVRARHSGVARRLLEAVDVAPFASCGVVDLEVLYSARDSEEHRRLREARALGYVHLELIQADLDRALEVQGLLADRGQHRGVGIPDLLIAAVAERAGLTVLHYDRDFERIAAVTGQPQEWVVPAGSAT